jgi:hypothetical protein
MLMREINMIRKRPLVAELVGGTFIPKMFQVRQVFPRPTLARTDIPPRINCLLDSLRDAEKIKKGMRIAITAGSRGIANEALIVKCLCDYVKGKGAFPFIIPAMGSHGGATAEGQKGILTEYGITESYCECPILSSMEVKRIGFTEKGGPVFIDKNASEADGIIVNCRIKPHTSFRGPYESGIMKMMAIGLGKQYGAEVCHAAGFKHMAENVPLYGKAIIKNAPILFGFATIENAYDETSELVAVNAEEIEEKEPGLLKKAASNMARILVDFCDLLVVDHIGKNFSGDGMDPNITGTFCTPYATGGINAQRVCVLDLSPETHGNAIGLGYSSATTQRVFDKIDLASMYPNAITCTVLGGVRIPIVMESDKEAMQVCLQTCNETDKNNPRVVRITDSLHIEHILLSEVYWNEVKDNPNLIIESKPEFLKFDDDGNLW